MSTPNTSLVKWVDSALIAKTKGKFCNVPVVELADLTGILCACCRAGLPYKDGFHSTHPKSRDYFKACNADAMLGTQLEAHRKEG